MGVREYQKRKQRPRNFVLSDRKKIALRIFPFTKNEVRKTGIEFLHKEPVTMLIDNNVIKLGNDGETVFENIETENALYVSARQKQTLTAVKRKPYFHFLVDTSEGKGIYFSDFEQRIETALFNAYKNGSYPVIVTVTDNILSSVLDENFSDFQFTFPESDLFFNLDRDGTLHAHSLVRNPREISEENTASAALSYTFDQSVLEYRLSDNSTAYLPNDNKPSVFLKKDVFKTNVKEVKEKDWQSALEMQANWMSQILHPKTSDKEWLGLVKRSLVSQVMTPVTSYLVVENEAQKAALKKKQEQVLSSKKSLDTSEDAQIMSEPGLWLLAILFRFILLYKQRRKRLCGDANNT